MGLQEKKNLSKKMEEDGKKKKRGSPPSRPTSEPNYILEDLLRHSDLSTAGEDSGAPPPPIHWMQLYQSSGDLHPEKNSGYRVKKWRSSSDVESCVQESADDA